MSGIHVHVFAGHDGVVPKTRVRKIGLSDLRDALKRGLDDFWGMPSYLAFVGVIYAFCGLLLASMTSYRNELHLLFPLAAGFALIGPFAAIGLYEMSRRRELGLQTNWKFAFNVLRSPSLPAIAALGLILVGIFLAWLACAEALWAWLFGVRGPASLAALLHMVVSTPKGWLLFGLGGLIGFGFSALTLCISAVSFPMLLDRDCGLVAAISTSLDVARKNPFALGAWGLIVAVLLVVGSLPLFVGLALVIPILGHSTWHLYRAAVERDPAQEHPPTDWPFEQWRNSALERQSKPHSFLFPER
jgi:uncharacterized membrane protein